MVEDQLICLFFFKQKTAYEMRISDWSSDVCSSDLYFNAEKPSDSHLQLTIQAASIDTRNADRDGHLKSNDFFDMETYPEITFASTAVEQRSEERRVGTECVSTCSSRCSPVH